MANRDVTARKTTEAQLIDRAMTDPAFRQELITEPKAVFERELGVEMPDNIDIQVLEETPSMVYLVLPKATPSADTELSDAELEDVSGGWSATTNDCPAETSCGGYTCSDPC